MLGDRIIGSLGWPVGLTFIEDLVLGIGFFLEGSSIRQVSLFASRRCRWHFEAGSCVCVCVCFVLLGWAFCNPSCVLRRAGLLEVDATRSQSPTAMRVGAGWARTSAGTGQSRKTFGASGQQSALDT